MASATDIAKRYYQALNEHDLDAAAGRRAPLREVAAAAAR
jgi:hypothetical protein